MPGFPSDLNRFRLPDAVMTGGTYASRKRPPSHRRGEHFIRGPIPCDWIEAAAKLPGKALHVGLVLWFQAGMSKFSEVKLTGKSADRFGVLPDAKRRALNHLEAAGLVNIGRGHGRCPVVTILEAPQRQHEAR